MKRNFVILLLFCSSLFALGNSQDEIQNYIAKYSRLAQKEMKHHGIPASITLAQGLLESGYGNSELAKKAKNHFGIKCTSSWKGKTYNTDDDKPNECFRKYKSVKKSYKDHSEFLHRDRYAELFNLDIKDYKAWAHGLKKCGYATNAKYPELLISIIQKYELHRFDSKRYRAKKIPTEIKDTEKEKSIGKSNGNAFYTAKKDDTLYSISKTMKVDLQKLKNANKLKDNTIFIGQKLIIPKN